MVLVVVLQLITFHFTLFYFETLLVYNYMFMCFKLQTVFYWTNGNSRSHVMFHLQETTKEKYDNFLQFIQSGK